MDIEKFKSAIEFTLKRFNTKKELIREYKITKIRDLLDLASEFNGKVYFNIISNNIDLNEAKDSRISYVRFSAAFDLLSIILQNAIKNSETIEFSFKLVPNPDYVNDPTIMIQLEKIKKGI